MKAGRVNTVVFNLCQIKSKLILGHPVELDHFSLDIGSSAMVS